MPLNNTGHNINAHRESTRRNGEYVTHFSVLSCSCSGSNEGRAQPNCRVCDGTGRVYGAGIRIKGLIATVSRNDKSLLAAGFVMPGDLTFSPDITTRTTIHDYDMLRLSAGQLFSDEAIERGVDRLSYGAVRVLMCEQHDPMTGARTSYRVGLDFVTNGRDVQWVDGHGPDGSTFYSIRYEAILDWIVFPQVTLHRTVRGGSVGQRVLLKQRHMFSADGLIPS